MMKEMNESTEPDEWRLARRGWKQPRGPNSPFDLGKTPHHNQSGDLIFRFC
jgi:hypothetical protein